MQRPGSTKGRHAMVICGYNGKDAFKVRNSWGTTWGEDGYGWMSEGYIAWHSTKSLWVPTKGIAV
jgi:C1A family cysteine protease